MQEVTVDVSSQPLLTPIPHYSPNYHPFRYFARFLIPKWVVDFLFFLVKENQSRGTMQFGIQNDELIFGVVAVAAVVVAAYDGWTSSRLHRITNQFGYFPEL
jgi:hypothetical protein